MRISRSSLQKGRYLNVDEEIDFSATDFSRFYPLSGVKSCHLSGLVEHNGDFLTFNAKLSATMVLIDSRDLKPFEEAVEIEDIIDLLENETEDGEGYIFPGRYIETSDIALALLRSATPIKPLSGRSDVREYVESKAEESREPSPFDVLADYSFDE